MNTELSPESKRKILNKRMKALRKALRRNKRSQVLQTSKGLAIDDKTPFGALVMAYLENTKSRQRGIPIFRDSVKPAIHNKKAAPSNV
ncbi:MAG: hypothetical protein UY48_C0009G0011 [Candidatus Gottesmanbacteria bacterium GW2011_GWB1_49_7]|uniref:Uncharacterized protein n=1 Tax=Candidatus Gottesmanbacteria bacterium GW2011_GWB1_49_7 TaxID=1618448 RepID=A0A0G1W234_9BACT|nr:MAG: hypothetical protein UY48_C0009G0011 [Candidatus Gottesmanbacteria bacterium GW2011_GWB1_49_7]